MQTPINPYAASDITNPNAQYAPYEQLEYQVAGKQVMVGKFTELPNVCYKTGEPVVEGKRYDKTLYSFNPLWALLILLGLIGIIIYVIVNLSTRKAVYVKYSLSKKARQKLMIKNLVGYSITFAIFCISGYSFVQGVSSHNDNDKMLLGLLGFLLGVIALFVTRAVTTVIRVKSELNGQFFLTGAGKPFLDYLNSQQPGGLKF